MIVDRLARLLGVFDLAIAELRHRRGRATLVVIAIALAVLAVTLLSSLGFGVLATGEAGFEEADPNLWVTGGPVAITETGGLENPVVDAHHLADEIAARDDVEGAQPIAFHGVYVGTDTENLELVPAVGFYKLGVDAGEEFTDPRAHYAEGDYDGPMTTEVIVDRATAERLDLAPGDTVLVGTSLEAAEEQTFTVVGISDRYRQFLGTSTVVIPLGELQRLAGTTGSDRAAYIVVSVAEEVDPGAVQTELDRAYPDYDVRTSEQQFESMLREQTLLLVSGAMLVGLAVVTGLLLTVNVLTLVAYQQRIELTALGALGLSRPVLAGVVGGQGLVLGAAGGALGVLLTPAIVNVLNTIAAWLVGFDGLLRTPPVVYVVGFAIALGVGTIAALVAGWRVSRIVRFDHLE
ncbi:ABC transporter permease [Natrialbaceae archaeon A-CW1-1]